MDIPTPEMIALEATYDDTLADDLINKMIVIPMICYYSGVPLRYKVSTAPYYRDTISYPLPISVNVVNRKLHKSGWHIKVIRTNEMEMRGNSQCYAYYFVLDRYIPPSPLEVRLRRAWNILIGKEQ